MQRRLHPDRGKIFGSPPAMGGFFLGGMWGEGCGLHRAVESGQDAWWRHGLRRLHPSILESHKKRNGRRLPGGIGGLVGMIIVTGKSVVVSGGLRGWVYIHPAPLAPSCPYPPAPQVPRSSSRSLPPDTHHPLSSRLAMIGGGGVIKMQRLTSVKLD